MIHQQGYTTGIDTDSAREKRNNTSYFDARNIEITNDEALGMASIQNKKGTRLSVKIPDTFSVYKIEFTAPSIPSVYTITVTQTSTGTSSVTTINATSVTTIENIYDQLKADIEATFTNQEIRVWKNNNYIVVSTYEDFTITSTGNIVTSTLVDPQVDLFIIGWKYVHDYLVIFTTAKTNTKDFFNNITTGAGQIWVLKYDESTGRAINDESTGNLLVDGSSLNSNHLIYNGQLDFSRAYPIQEEIEGRYENPETIRVFWTDNFNNFRSINIKDSQVFAIPIGNIDVVSSVQLNIPIIKQVINGGMIPAGRVAYFYSEKDNNGAITAFSPSSGLISLTASTDGDFTNYQQFQGSSIGTNSGKSVKFEITGIDTNFDIIELYYIIYEQLNVPRIFKFREEPITGETMSFTHNGDPTSDIEILYEDFLKLRKAFDVCKTIASKNNILFAANTKSRKSDFSEDFDARSYGFYQSDLNLRLVNRNGTTDFIPINSYADYLSVDSEHDCINPYNDESGSCFGIFSGRAPSDWDGDTTGEYKWRFQRNSTTLGGSGANISYSFTTQEFIGDNYLPVGASTPDTAPFLSADNYISGNETLGIFDQTYTRNNTYDNLRSPYASYMYTGYAAGEIYRWAIVFYDLQGYPSYPLWIGDIKFPQRQDTGFELTNYSSSKQRVRSIGIQFTLDTTTAQFQSIKDKITGWRFVRVKREETDKTKLGHGAIFDCTTGNVRQADGTVLNNRDKITDEANVTTPTYTSGTNIIKSPICDFDKYNFKTSDYLKTLHTYDRTTNQYYVSGASHAEWGKFTSINASPTSSHRRTISKITTVDNAGYLSATYTGSNEFYNVSALAAGTGYVRGLGQKLHYIQSATAIEAYGNRYRVISYERYNNTQYGGPYYINRFDNIYISTGHFQPWNPYDSSDPVNTILTTKVFGGDTITCYYASLFYSFASFGTTAEDYGYNDDGDGQEYAIVYPCEVPFNPELRQGTTWAKDRTNTDLSTFLFEQFAYNDAYSQENSTELFISKSLNQRDQDEQPYTIWASDRKIDGETTDSWRNFKQNNPLSVDGQHGPINKIITYKDRLYYYQNRALGISAVEERIQQSQGTAEEAVLGTGGILARYDYISTETGCIHRSAVVGGLHGLYHVDALNSKIYRLSSNGIEELSLTKKVSSLLRELVTGAVKDTDNNMTDFRTGIVTGYDYKFNKVYFTILNIESTTVNNETLDVPIAETLSFNEIMNYFDSKHDFKPSLYLTSQRKFLSTDYNQNTDINKRDNNIVYIHGEDNYGRIYETYYDSYIKTLLAPIPKVPKRFDTFELQTNVTLNDVDVPNETVNKVRSSTDYQTSTIVTLTPNTNIRRRFRRWLTNVPRDQVNARNMSVGFFPQMRDYTMFGEFWFTNNNNKRFIMGDILIHYNP